MRESWAIASLGDICKIKPPKNEAKQKLSDIDMVSFVPMNDLGIRQKSLTPSTERRLGDVSGSYTYFAKGDVLLAKITPCFENGKLGIASRLKNGIGFGSSEFIVLRPNGELDPEYLFYFLSQDNFRDAGARVMSGAVGHKRLPKEFIEKYPIPFPPLPEQKRIVAILDEAFAGIEKAVANTEKNLANARELFESHLNAVFDRAYNSSKIVLLSEITTDITDGDHMPPPKSKTGVPFVTIRNINKTTREIDFNDTFMVPCEYFESLKANKRPQKGDVLYTVTGSFGIPVLVEYAKDFCFQRHIGLIRPKPIINSKWLTYLLMSPQVLRQANDKATGTAQKTVSLKALRDFRVPVMPQNDQFNAVIKLDELFSETQRLESIYQQKLTALAELKQSLLQKAFSGELTANANNKLKEAAA